MSGYDEFFAAQARGNDQRYQGAQAQATMVVTRTETDSAGAVIAAYGTLQGESVDVEFYMPLRGFAASVGDHLLGSYPANDPSGGELVYVRHVYSDNVAAGLLVVDANLPAPQFGTVPFLTGMDSSAGSIVSWLVVNLIDVGAKYQPSGNRIYYRVSGATAWLHQDGAIGTDSIRLAATFPPGTYVDVQLSATYSWASEESVPTAVRTVQVAVDNITPGNATALIVETNTPGGLNIFAEGALDNAHFDHWRYEIATAPNGNGLTVRDGQSPYFFTGASGNYYVAVSPISKSGIVGGRYPGTGYFGPTFLNNPTQPLDTTPPPDWTIAPTLAMQRVVTNNNGEQAQLTITLPTYPYPADYAETLVYVVTNANTQAPTQRIPPGVGSATLFVQFGTVSVTLRGLDKAGNLSANPSPAATAALQPSGAPQIAPTLRVSTFALAIKLDWNVVPYALAYEVQRAPDVNGAPGTFTDFASLDARMYLDTLVNETVVLPSYWYQVRAINALGSGPYSAYKQGFAGAVDARNLRLQSVTAAQIAADAIAANNIQAGAITASKLSSDLVLATLFRTANAGSRVEIHGQIFGDVNSNSILMVSGASTVRARLSGDALTYYNDNGSPAITFGATGGIGYMQSAGGFLIHGHYTNLDLAANQYMRWNYDNPDSAGNIFNQEIFLARIKGSNGSSQGMGLIGLQRTNGGNYRPPRFTFGYSLDPLAAANQPGEYVSMEGGILTTTAYTVAPQYVFSTAGQASGVSLIYTGGNVDLRPAPFRVVSADGAAWKIMHTGGGGNAHQDWSNGALYLGWFANGGQQVIVGNGAQAYGPIAASAFAVNSTAQDKQNIADPSGMWAKLAQLRPRAYQLKADPTVTRYGFVAEEVRAIMPELVTTLPAAPYAGPVAPDLLPQPTPALDVYGLLTTIAAGLVEAAKGATATIAAQATTIQGQATRLGQAQARLTALETTVADLAARLKVVEGKVPL